MRSVRNCFELIIILIAIGAALYTQRMSISDWMRTRTQPALPEAVVYEEVRGEAGGNGEEVIGRRQEADEAVGNRQEAESEKTEIVTEEKKEEGVKLVVDSTPAVLPAAFNLAVPFTSQAPTGSWEEPFKEACEETSLYMVQAFYSGITDETIDPQTAEKALRKIVAFEMELFGKYLDTTIEETFTLAEQMYWIGGKVIEDPTVDQIKTEISLGHPVIVPLAGRLIGNPYYTAPGPVYHMLVIRGYTADGKFITNDPGTKHGREYLYDFDTIIQAIHDWNGGNEITEGKKVVLVLSPRPYDYEYDDTEF